MQIIDPLPEFFNDKKVLVTGGTGLVGRQLLHILAPIAKEVHSVSLDKLEPEEGVVYHNEDLRNFNNCLIYTKDMDVVFHVAGIKGNPDVTSSNVSTVFVPYLQFNTNVLEACRINKVGRVVYTSTIGAYSSNEVFKETDILEGAPMDGWAGWAKRMAEMQIKSYKLQYGLNNFIAVRPSNIYGPGDNFDPDNAMVIPSLLMKIIRGDDPVNIWGNGTAIRDFVFSRDVAKGLMLAACHMPNVDYLNIGSGIGITIAELVNVLQKFKSFNAFFDVAKPNGYPKRVMDIANACNLISYVPGTSLYAGLKETIEWFLENTDEYKQRKNYFVEDEI